MKIAFEKIEIIEAGGFFNVVATTVSGNKWIVGQSDDYVCARIKYNKSQKRGFFFRNKSVRWEA